LPQPSSQSFQSSPHPSQPASQPALQPTLKLVTPKPVTANPAEIQTNPRSRSAKLRVAERL
jgi:16S rRNA (cytosine1402-N4)-methyltransferase